MVAGVLLGPSLLGAFAPQAQQWLFPKQSMPVLYAISQIGLVLYMFLVGHEFNIELIRGKSRQAAAISIAGILVPMTGGALLALTVRSRGDLFASTLSPGAAMLYLGAAMSITAFPMLARILEEKRIMRTRLGTLSLAAGSMDDAIAWCLLALVLATFNRSPMIAALAIGGGIVYALVMLAIVRPRLQWFSRSLERNGELTPQAFTALLAIVMLCAWVTDAVGVYAVFGAFICGTAMPRGRFADEVRLRMHFVTSSLL